MIHSSSKNFQPGQLPNSEQKADEMHFSPAIANANVGGWWSFNRLLFLCLYSLVSF